MTLRRGPTVKRAERAWGATIKEIRQSQSITQAAMAERLNMTFSNYTKIERGVIGCRLGVAIKICKILKIKKIEVE
jgi:transcriptional regulator with XRE-family HTH domain